MARNKYISVAGMKLLLHAWDDLLDQGEEWWALRAYHIAHGIGGDSGPVCLEARIILSQN